MDTHSKLVKSALLAAVSLAACGEGQDMQGNLGDQGVGEVVVDLTAVPSNVRCIAIFLGRFPNDPSPLETDFPVAANAANASLNMGRIDLGFAEFSGQAWDLDCADPMLPFTTPSWQAGAVATTVAIGVTTHVRLNFFANDPTTVDANFVKNLADVTPGSLDTYARFGDGTIWQWGAQGGNLNNVSTIPRPFTLAPLLAAKVVVGFSFSCALMTNGTVKCWGSNQRGQLGPGVAVGASSLTPVNVPFTGTTAIDIAAGDNHACVITSIDNVLCWGDNTWGQLGVDPGGPPAVPFSATPVLAFNEVGSRIAAGSNSNCAFASGSMSCWGRNDGGQLGNGTTSTAPQSIPTTVNTRGVVDVAMGQAHACVLHADGSVGCWGTNTNGQVGDGTTVTRLTEVKIFMANGPASTIVAGANHSCMLSTNNPSLPDRILTCWGANAAGQLGDGTSIDRTTPAPRFAVLGVFTRNSNTTCILRAGLGVLLDLQCAGSNNLGQIGDGTRNVRYQFTSVTF